jgi:hypothetical protein
LYIFHLIIIFSILGFLGHIGQDISNGISQVGKDISNAINTGYGDLTREMGSITTSLPRDIMIASIKAFMAFISPALNFFKDIDKWTAPAIVSFIDYVISVIIGIPQGFINAMSSMLGGLGIFGFPVTLILISIGVLIIVAISLAIVKLIQYLIEVL